MASHQNDLEPRLLGLPATERARLAGVLLASLDGDAEHEAEWLEEIRRRLAEIDDDVVVTIPSAAVLAAARARLR